MFDYNSEEAMSNRSTISVDELRVFHSADRRMFTRLVVEMMRDPAEALLVIAAWLWLHHARGFPNIIARAREVSKCIINPLFDEALLLLRALDASTPRVVLTPGVPLTACVLGGDLSLHALAQRPNRLVAVAGIRRVLRTVCARAFTDILERVLFGPAQGLLIVPGFPHRVFGNLAVDTLAREHPIPPNIWEDGNDDSECDELGCLDEIPEEDGDSFVPEDFRTLFLTFSRGFPVSRSEVLEVFAEAYGDCVERVEMGNMSSSFEQALYARLILKNVFSVERILNGRRVTKFRVNGKHIWARRYEIRD